MLQEITTLWNVAEKEQLTQTREFLHLRAKQWEERYVNVLQFMDLWSRDPELYVDLNQRLVGYLEDLKALQTTKRLSKFVLSLQELFDDPKYNEEIGRFYQARRALYNFNHKHNGGLQMHDLIRDFGTVKLAGDEKYRYTTAMFGGQPKKVAIQEKIKNSLDLITRIEELPAGKALDISKMDKFGQGSKLMSIPKTTKGKKKGMLSLPLYSDNYDAFLLAMDLLPTVDGTTAAMRYQNDLKELKRIFYPQLPEDAPVRQALLPLATERISLADDYVANDGVVFIDEPQRLTVPVERPTLPSLKIADFEDDPFEYNFVGDRPQLKSDQLIVNRGQYFDDREYEDSQIEFNEQDPYDDQNFEDNSPLTANAVTYNRPETISQRNTYTGSQSNAVNKALADADIDI